MPFPLQLQHLRCRRRCGRRRPSTSRSSARGAGVTSRRCARASSTKRCWRRSTWRSRPPTRSRPPRARGGPPRPCPPIPGACSPNSRVGATAAGHLDRRSGVVVLFVQMGALRLRCPDEFRTPRFPRRVAVRVRVDRTQLGAHEFADSQDRGVGEIQHEAQPLRGRLTPAVGPPQAVSDDPDELPLVLGEGVRRVKLRRPAASHPDAGEDRGCGAPTQRARGLGRRRNPR